MSLEKLTQSADPGKSSAPPRRTRSWAWLLPGGLLLGFLSIIALLFGSRLLPATEVTTAPVVTVRLGQQDAANAANTSGSINKQLLFQASGWVEPDPYVTYVPVLVNGVIDEVFVLDGDAVKEGQVLATLISDDAKLDLTQATQQIESQKARIEAHCIGLDILNAELNAAQKNKEANETLLAEAQDNLKRLRTVRSGAVSEQSIFQAELVVKRQEAQLAEVSAEIPRLRAKVAQLNAERKMMDSTLTELETARARAQLALDRTQIKAPMDGIVLRRHATPGKKRLLAADDPLSAVVVELYDPTKLQARIDVPLNEAAGLRIGQPVELTCELLPDQLLTGTVTSIAGEADLQRNTLQAKVAIDSPDPRIRPETLVRGKFFTGGTASAPLDNNTSTRLALYVPEQALVNESSVWVVSPERTAELRPLTLGNDTRDGHRRVIKGIRSGEQIILPPHDDLEPGSRVKSASLR
ncbi:efflux RND transporter periplasmic adaptor subunit [Sulfuriroseicoccus oceanibius]|uniref:Efflux RND transporter periplasmic adaptor subunit n=1 Tax=Sulfuriroseicoccus oceanibius TaxID=2707525 RepID=A0A6B3L4F4_9BACT|nr:efflux RND transporter periplasmic adaptor subunit [Sulfuriroseicoccus oceanibius]QQL45599.1 efflux RND transporter periplasmic adaptor subunit [Sulfuriroseicoccus oceanibius]